MSLVELISRYEEGIASPEEVAELNHLLLNNKSSQDDFLLHAELDAHLRLEALSASDDREPLDLAENQVMDPQSLSFRSSGSFARFGWAVAAAVIFMVFGTLWLMRDPDESVITLTSVSGPVSWMGDKGQVTSDLSVGRKLNGGTMELLSPSSSVEFAFNDKSVVKLAGLSAITVTCNQADGRSDSQKELHLRHGQLSASVTPQPEGLPLLVQTPSAEMTVLGTRFDVISGLDATRLSVNEGRVHLKRLLDGQEVEVPARQSVMATLEDDDALLLRSRDSSVTEWSSDLRNDVFMGKWVPRIWSLAADLKKAVANQKMTREDAASFYKDAANIDDSTGSVWSQPSKLGSIMVLSPRQLIEQPVHLEPTSQLVLHGRTYDKGPMQIGISVNEAGGGFAGKFMTEVQASQIAGEEGFLISLPITELRGRIGTDRSPVGYEISDIWCLIKNSAAKFEIISVELKDIPTAED